MKTQPMQLELPSLMPRLVPASDMSATETVSLVDCLRLSLLITEGGLGGRNIRLLAAHVGGYRALLGLSEKSLLETLGGPADRIHRLAAALKSGLLNERTFRLEEQCQQQKIAAVACSDPLYPQRLRQISGLPVVLFWRGHDIGPLFQDANVATIIGTRRPTGYGRLMARRIAEPLAQSGIIIVSGLARGIDTVAHEAALAAGRPTVGVLACGVDIAYPPENAGLIERISATGAVISEHVPGTPPVRTYFPARNRILSGLSDAVIIIEASLKSGSMITASYAADQGRDVYAVPGNALSRESEGCNRLIREGAFLLTEAEDVLWRIPSARRLDAFSAALDSQSDDPEEEDAICHLLRGGAMTLNDLSSLLGEPLPEILCRLTDLEIRGSIRRDRGHFTLTGG